MEIDWLHRKGPTLSVVVMACVPFLGALTVSFGALGADLRPGGALSMTVMSVVAVLALVLLLSRVRLAPAFAAVAALLAWVSARLVATTVGAMTVVEWNGIRPGTGGDLAAPAVVMAVAAALAIWRRAAFDRPLRVGELLASVLEGGRALLRPSPGAPIRALCAVGLLVVGFIALGFLLPDASSAEGSSPWGGFVVAFSAGTGVFVGLALMLSSFQLPDEEGLSSRTAPSEPARAAGPVGPSKGGGPRSPAPPAAERSEPPPSILEGPAIGELPPSLRDRRRKP